MADKNIRVDDPASRETQKEYDRSDVESVLRVREWRDWDELLQWLRNEGDTHRRLTPGEVRHLVEDVQRAQRRGVPFRADADYLWRELKK